MVMEVKLFLSLQLKAANDIQLKTNLTRLKYATLLGSTLFLHCIATGNDKEHETKKDNRVVLHLTQTHNDAFRFTSEEMRDI